MGRSLLGPTVGARRHRFKARHRGRPRLDRVPVDVTSKRRVGGLPIFPDASATALRETVTRQSMSSGLTNSIGPLPARLPHGEFSMVGDNINDARGPIAANGPTLPPGSRPRAIGLGVRVAQVRMNPSLDRDAASSRNAPNKEL